GLHAMIFTNDGTVYIDPYTDATADYYISYFKSEFYKNNSKVFNEAAPVEGTEIKLNNSNKRSSSSTGEQLRTYRLALACTGEYASYHGGTKPSVLSAMTTSVNRVAGIYEREFSVTFVLIPNNDTLIFLNSGSDPYTNNNGGTMLGQNQSTLDSYIGSANYDMGHVFSTGGGGIAGLGVICNNSSKARGVTGLNNPIGDPFDVDYVAHEMGHQFDGRHTWNYCGGGGGTSTSWEPGSATTIMGYAGLCGSANIQNSSDDYFHSGNYTEVSDFTQIGGANNCPTITATGNNAPTISAGTGAFLPISTPFVLTGAGSDPDGNSITYCWEQFDIGPGVHPNSPSGNCPLFRSYDPTPDNFRYFPRLQNIINNQNTTLAEKLPSYGRNMNFRCTVRDNLGGVDWDAVFFTVDAGSGPFEVMYPNTNITWAVNDTRTVTWDVANTDASPVSCSMVNILLSTDGGNTYPVTLIANTPNDGSEPITVPNNQSTQCRVMVQAVNNVFFDISNSNFRIDMSSGIVELSDDDIHMYPNPANNEVHFAINDLSSEINIEIISSLGQLIASENLSGMSDFTVSTANLSAGVYSVRISQNKKVSNQRLVINK
ncbi:MAG: T9SS type A sorting domain-containing protein, partial [Bacteroidia bacterium]|nr:T9SS type A sorting domain-containing protein [Bacteroidia bacterium]